ncbi:hypothetical protein RY27_15795 [Litorilinea aerophila]|nr:hypothetical protein RY27_15795 [Litorilinea aerophila]
MDAYFVCDGPAPTDIYPSSLVGRVGSLYEADDGLTNQEESTLGTDPTDPDTDDDGTLDGQDPEPHNHRLPHSQGGPRD